MFFIQRFGNQYFIKENFITKSHSGVNIIKNDHDIYSVQCIRYLHKRIRAD